MTEMQKSADPKDPRSANAARPEHPAARQHAGGSGTATTREKAGPTTGPATAAGPPQTAVQLALHAGWTMALLYGEITPRTSRLPELPTVNQLPAGERRKLELRRLESLLKQLASLPEGTGSGLSAQVPGIDEHEAHNEALREFNRAILDALAAAQPEIELAYELGRSLRDTVNPPSDPKAAKSLADELARQLAPGRVATLQERLAALATQFPPRTAAIVAASVGRWSDLAVVTLGAPAGPASTSTQETIPLAPGAGTPAPAAGTRAPVAGTRARGQLKRSSKAEVAERMSEYLLRQGDAWRMLLTGARSTDGLLSPEGYVAAGEAALQRTAKIVRRVIQHYWVALVVMAAALGGLLYLAIASLGGAAEVWTTIATTAGSLGISARTITSTTARLAAEAERPVLTMAEEDAMAWAITTMPPVSLTARGVRQLRKAGIAPTGTLGRV